MDPNAALNSILHGHMMRDHVEALRDWLLASGFRPLPVYRPVDVTPALANLPFNVGLSADARGLCVGDARSARNGELLYTWAELFTMADALEAE